MLNHKLLFCTDCTHYEHACRIYISYHLNYSDLRKDGTKRWGSGSKSSDLYWRNLTEKANQKGKLYPELLLQFPSAFNVYTSLQATYNYPCCKQSFWDLSAGSCISDQLFFSRQRGCIANMLILVLMHPHIYDNCYVSRLPNR